MAAAREGLVSAHLEHMKTAHPNLLKVHTHASSPEHVHTRRMPEFVLPGHGGKQSARPGTGVA